MEKISAIQKAIVLYVCVLLLAACSSGSGSGSGDDDTDFVPTDPDQVFSLSKWLTTETGPVYSAQLTGIDSNGVTYSGSIAKLNRANEMYSGLDTTPSDLIITLTGGGSSTTVTGTSYVDEFGNTIAVFIQTTGVTGVTEVTCTLVTPGSLPPSAKIGDSGILSALNCDDNTTESQIMEVEDADNGSINVVIISTNRDELDIPTQISDLSFTLNSSGDIVSFKTVSIILATNFTLSFQSI